MRVAVCCCRLMQCSEAMLSAMPLVKAKIWELEVDLFCVGGIAVAEVLVVRCFVRFASVCIVAVAIVAADLVAAAVFSIAAAVVRLLSKPHWHWWTYLVLLPEAPDFVL